MEKRCKTTNVIPCTTSEVCLLRVSCLYAAFEALKKRKTNTMAKNVLQLGENKIRILRSIEDYIFNKSWCFHLISLCYCIRCWFLNYLKVKYILAVRAHWWNVPVVFLIYHRSLLFKSALEWTKAGHSRCPCSSPACSDARPERRVLLYKQFCIVMRVRLSCIFITLKTKIKILFYSSCLPRNTGVAMGGIVCLNLWKYLGKTSCIHYEGKSG